MYFLYNIIKDTYYPKWTVEDAGPYRICANIVRLTVVQIKFDTIVKIISSHIIPRLSVGEDIILPNIIKKDFRQNENPPKLFIIHYSLFIIHYTYIVMGGHYA